MDDLASVGGWAPSCEREMEAQGEEAARVRVPAPRGTGQQKYSYCLIVLSYYNFLYEGKNWAKPLIRPTGGPPPAI